MRYTKKFIRAEAKKHMTEGNGRSQRGCHIKKGLDPIYPTAGQGAPKEQMIG